MQTDTFAGPVGHRGAGRSWSVAAGETTRTAVTVSAVTRHALLGVGERSRDVEADQHRGDELILGDQTEHRQQAAFPELGEGLGVEPLRDGVIDHEGVGQPVGELRDRGQALGSGSGEDDVDRVLRQPGSRRGGPVRVNLVVSAPLRADGEDDRLADVRRKARRR